MPTCLTVNMEGALTSYHSFLRKGSTAFFLPPFFPLDMRLFLPTAMVTEGVSLSRRVKRVRPAGGPSSYGFISLFLGFFR